jgi:hypothetical protein
MLKEHRPPANIEFEGKKRSAAVVPDDRKHTAATTIVGEAGTTYHPFTQKVINLIPLKPVKTQGQRHKWGATPSRSAATPSMERRCPLIRRRGEPTTNTLSSSIDEDRQGAAPACCPTRLEEDNLDGTPRRSTESPSPWYHTAACLPPRSARRRRRSTEGAALRRTRVKDTATPSPTRRLTTLSASPTTTQIFEGRSKPNPRRPKKSSLKPRETPDGDLVAPIYLQDDGQRGGGGGGGQRCCHWRLSRLGVDLSKVESLRRLFF